MAGRRNGGNFGGNGRSVEGMTYTELLTLRNRIDRLLAEKRHEELAATRKRIADLAQQGGFQLAELISARRGRPSRQGKIGGKIAPKYQDPKNPSNVWTGRGRPPRWMAEQLKGGKRRKEDFLIQT